MPAEDNQPPPTDLKKVRGTKKGIVTRSIHNIKRTVIEEDLTDAKGRLDTLKEKFNDFEKAHDEFHETLTDDQEIDNSEKYFYEAEYEYMQTVQGVKLWIKTVEGLPPSAVISSKPDISPKAEASVSNSVLQDNLVKDSLLNLINLPKVELECFDGDPMKYHSFIAIFDENVGQITCDDKIKLTRILQYTSGHAKDAIRSCALLGGERGYKQAREILQKRFGNDHLISEYIISSLKSGCPVKSPTELRMLADELLNCYTMLSSMERLSEMDTQSCITDIASRLQPYIRTRWKRHAMEVKRSSDKYPDFKNLVDFVCKEADEATDPVYGKWNVSTKHSESQPKKHFTSLVTSTMSTTSFAHSRQQSCVICREDHRLFWCPQFKSMKPTERLQLVKDNRLCENCLLSNHIVSDCRKASVCSVPGCGKKHTKFIHIDQDRDSDMPGTEVTHHITANQIKIDKVDSDNNKPVNVCVPVVPVLINDEYIVHAMLDSASTSTFCTRSLVQKLHLKGKVVNYTLDTLSKSQEHKCSEVVSFKLNTNDGDCLKLNGVFVIDNIPFSSSPVDVQYYSHLRDLPISRHVNSVDILIGQDHSEALMPLETRMGKRGDPFAIRTVLGWSLNGPAVTIDSVGKHVVTHFISTNTVEDQDSKVENEVLNSHNLAWSQCDNKVIKFRDDDVKVSCEFPLPCQLDVYVPCDLGAAESRLSSDCLKSLETKEHDGLVIDGVRNLLNCGDFCFTYSIGTDDRIGGGVLFRDATRLQLSWDSIVSVELSSKWIKLLQSFSDLSYVQLPRCVKPRLSTDCHLELHHFSPTELRSSRRNQVPAFLQCKNTMKLESDFGEIPEDDPEVKANVAAKEAHGEAKVGHVNFSMASIGILLTTLWIIVQISTVAWWHRLTRLCYSAEFESGPSVSELSDAEHSIVKPVQSQVHHKEMTSLSDCRGVEKSSRDSDLDSFLNLGDLLGIGGRSHSADLDRKRKSNFIVRESHSVGYLGPKWTLSRLKLKYFVSVNDVVSTFTNRFTFMCDGIIKLCFDKMTCTGDLITNIV